MTSTFVAKVTSHGRNAESRLIRPHGAPRTRVAHSGCTLLRRVFERGGDVTFFEIGKIAQDFGGRRSTGQDVEHILHAHAQAPDAGTPAKNLRVRGDAVEMPGH